MINTSTPLSVSTMTGEQLDAELKKGYAFHKSRKNIFCR